MDRGRDNRDGMMDEPTDGINSRDWMGADMPINPDEMQSPQDQNENSLQSSALVPTDATAGKPDDILSQISNDDLAIYVMNLLRNDIADKEDGGWTDKREYDINSYEGNKRPTNFPWVNACNFPVPLTPTLLDTAHANIMGSIFADPENTTDVQGVGVEDIRMAPILNQMLNWQINTEIDTYEVWDKAVFRSLMHGTGVVKVMQSYTEKKVVLNSVPVELIYVPIDAKGFQTHQTDHVFEIIPLTANDMEERKNIINQKTGKPVYEGLEDIPPGLRFAQSTTLDVTTRQKDFITGTKIADRMTRDLFYIMECYITYYRTLPNGKKSAEPVELIVTIAPTSSQVIRKAINETKIRPYVQLIPYPNDDRFYGKSLPEKIKTIQEELDYSHNQNINAADRAISPPGFYKPTSGFDPDRMQIAPASMYSVSEPPSFPSISVNPIFERQEDRYWDLAERLTGLTELFQGRAPSKTKTLGEAKLRNNRSEVRFKALYQRYEKAWSDMIRLIYFYDTIWMPKDKKIKVAGVNDFKSIDELFPEGLEGQFNFTFRNAPLTEIEVKKQDIVAMCEYLLTQPIVQSDKGTTWKVLKKYAEAKGERNIESLITKPEQANILSPEEAIQRIMSGQYEVIPEPGIDAANYLLRLQLFMISDTFKNAKPQAQQAIVKLLQRSDAIRRGQTQAKNDAMILKRGPQPQGMGEPQQGQPPAMGGDQGGQPPMQGGQQGGMQ